MSVESANDLLRAAGIVSVADCAKCEHSEPYGDSRRCNAHGGQMCYNVNFKGDCQRFELREKDFRDRLPPDAERLPPGIIANCAECRHSEPHPRYFKTEGRRLCNARGGENCKLVNSDGRCKDFDPRLRDKSQQPKRKGFWARLFGL